jgi:hypothetical protein
MAKTGLQNNASKEVTTLMAPLSFVQDPNKAFDQRRERPHNNIPNGKSDIHKSMSLQGQHIYLWKLKSSRHCRADLRLLQPPFAITAPPQGRLLDIYIA